MPQLILNPCPRYLQLHLLLDQDGVGGVRGFLGVSALLSPLPGKDLLVTVTESFEHTQRVSQHPDPCRPNPACFHYPKYFQSQMHGEMPRSQWRCGVQGGIGGWHGGLGLAGCQTSPSPPLTEPPILPALLLWQAQEERPCLPAPRLPPRWPDGDPACGEVLGLGRVP